MSETKPIDLRSDTVTRPTAAIATHWRSIEQEAHRQVLQRDAEGRVIEQRRRVFRGAVDDGPDADPRLVHP